MSLEDDLKDLEALYGVRMEPELGLTPYHRRIVATKPIPGTSAGHICELECGHLTMTFGKLSHAIEGQVLCTECRKEATPITRERQIFKCQRPVECTPGAEREILIYNQDGSLRFQGEVTDRALQKMFPNGEYKVFRYGRAWEHGGRTIEIDEEAPWQEW